MSVVLALFLSLLISPAAFAAAEAPAWVESVPKDSATAKYYVGYANGKTRKEASDGAETNAVKRAITDNFGMEFEYFQSVYEDLSAVDLAAHSTEKMAARLVGFRAEKTYTLKGKTAWEAWVLCSYSKKEIAAEKKRLKEKKPEKKDSAGVRSSSSGVVDLTTFPVRDASVYIDGQLVSQNKSNVKINWENGKHVLEIDHPLYKRFSKKISVETKQTTAVVAQLEVAKIRVNVETAGGEDAQIFLNGVKQGDTPRTLTIRLDTDNTIVLKNDEFYEYALSLSGLTREDDNKTFMAQMTEKSAFASFTSLPQGASVFVDGEKIGETGAKPLKKEIARGRHAYKIYKAGYLEEKGEFTAIGGQTAPVHASLSKDSDYAGIVLLDKETPLADIPAPVVKKRAKRNVATPLTDKNHEFELTLLPKTRPVIPNAAKLNDYVKALMKWDYTDNLLRAAVSYAQDGDNLVVYARVFFDGAAYESLFVKEVLKLAKVLEFKEKSGDILFECAGATEKHCLLQSYKKKQDCKDVKVGEEKHWYGNTPIMEKKCRWINVPKCAKKVPPQLNQRCAVSYELPTRTVTYEVEAGVDKNYETIMEKRSYKQDVSSVWLLEDLKDAVRVNSDTDADAHVLVAPKELAIDTSVPNEKERLLVIEITLKNGRTITQKILFGVSKFETKGKIAVAFVPRVNANPQQYVTPIYFKNVKASDVKSVRLSFEKGAK